MNFKRMLLSFSIASAIAGAAFVPVVAMEHQPNVPQASLSSSSSSNFEVDKDVFCAICHTTLVELVQQGKILLQTLCKHIYCSDCWEFLWKGKSNGIDCPLCRRKISLITEVSRYELPGELRPQITQKQVSLLKKNIDELWQRMRALQQLAKVQEVGQLQLREERIGRVIEEVARGFKEPVVNIIRAVAYINCPLLFFINLSLAQGMGIFEQHTTALFAMLKAVKRLYNCFLPTLFVNGFSSSLDSICMSSWAFIEVAFLLYEKILFIQEAPDFREKMKVIVGGLAFLTFFSVFAATV